MSIPSEGYCPTCRTVSLLNRRGECVWCDHPIAVRVTEPKRRKGPSPGVPLLMQEDVIVDARAMYAEGRALAAVAAELLPRTDYASVTTLAQALRKVFAYRGYPLRSKAEQLVTQSRKHARLMREDPLRAEERLARIMRGENPSRMCLGTITNGTRAGQPCSRHARAGADYCNAHDPALRERQLERAAHMRSARGVNRGA